MKNSNNSNKDFLSFVKKNYPLASAALELSLKTARSFLTLEEFLKHPVRHKEAIVPHLAARSKKHFIEYELHENDHEKMIETLTKMLTYDEPLLASKRKHAVSLTKGEIKSSAPVEELKELLYTPPVITEREFEMPKQRELPLMTVVYNADKVTVPNLDLIPDREWRKIRNFI